jgi:hypothetical protein
VITGIDKRSAIHPACITPATIRMVPVSSASPAARPAYCGEPEAAIVASAPAKIGAIVESAPTEAKRLTPNAANPIEPAISAYRPVCGSSPARLAVASCSGIEIAASIRPATRSAGSHDGWYPRNAAKVHAGEDALSSFEAFAPSAFKTIWEP